MLGILESKVTVPLGLEGVLMTDPQKMHGKLCFSGTRVPLTVFLDIQSEDMGVEEFLSIYPSVAPLQLEAILNWENEIIPSAVGLKLAG